MQIFIVFYFQEHCTYVMQLWDESIITDWESHKLYKPVKSDLTGAEVEWSCAPSNVPVPDFANEQL